MTSPQGTLRVAQMLVWELSLDSREVGRRAEEGGEGKEKQNNKK